MAIAGRHRRYRSQHEFRNRIQSNGEFIEPQSSDFREPFSGTNFSLMRHHPPECVRRESNPHTFRYWNLNPARLPVPPPTQQEVSYDNSPRIRIPKGAIWLSLGPFWNFSDKIDIFALTVNQERSFLRSGEWKILPPLPKTNPKTIRRGFDE
jgi:hypothetical protein